MCGSLSSSCNLIFSVCFTRTQACRGPGKQSSCRALAHVLACVCATLQIICGMCLLGAVGDRIGRKWGSVMTASIMLLGAAMLTASDGATPKGFTVMFLISQFVFGFEVPPCHQSACMRCLPACTVCGMHAA